MGPRMKRFDDWPEQLAATVAAAQARPFAFGTHDCGLFAADCVLSMTGVDIAEGFRGAYADEAGAMAIEARHGGVQGLMTTVLGYPVPVPQVHRGDVVMLEEDGRRTLGICMGAGSAFVGRAGLLMVPTLRCAVGWRV